MEQFDVKIFYFVDRKHDHLVREMLAEIEEVLARYPDLQATLED